MEGLGETRYVGDTSKAIADFENHCRDDRLLDIGHDIVSLLAERVHPNSAERKASVDRIESMYTSLEFPEDMVDVERGIYTHFRRVLGIVGTQVGTTIVGAPYYLDSRLAIVMCCLLM
jgi:hypothetical protein